MNRLHSFADAMRSRLKLWIFLRFGQKRKGIFYIGGSDVLPPPLSHDEESRMLEEYAKGSMEARSVLIELNL